MYFKKYEHESYLVFRVIVGVLFLFHGLQKFGVFGGEAAPFLSLFWAAGAIEIIVGLAVTLGKYVTWASLLGAAEMVVAYIMFHAPNGWNPLMNKGELALLYVAAFLALMAYGSKKA